LEEQKEQTPSQKPKQSLLKKLVRGLLAAVLLLMLFTVFIVAFTQTSWFRNIVAHQIENLIADKTNATVKLGHIDGNFISGFTIYDAHLKIRGDTTEILSTDQIYARYSLWELIKGNEIPISNLTVRSPSIQFVKLFGDSLWNYERLFPAQKQGGKSSPFNLAINIQNLRIENAKLTVRDYNAVHINDSIINWNNIAIENINLDMSVHINGEKTQQAQINNVSCEIPRKNNIFHLYHLEFAAYHDDLHLDISGLHLISDESDIRVAALLDPLSVMAGKPLDSLEHSQTKLVLSARSVSAGELKQFLPDLAFLGSNPSLELEAEGEFGKLKITKGTIGFHHDGTIAFSGEIKNLHTPEHLYLDVSLKGRSLSDRTLRNYVPGLGITDMQRYGEVNIEKLTFKGYPNNFSSTFDITSAVGTTTGKTALDLRGREMIYDANASTKNINLARIFSDSSLKSDLNSTFTMKGRGTNPKTMQAHFQLDGDGVTGFKNYRIEKLHVGGKIGGAKLELENTDIELYRGASLTSTYAMMDFADTTPSYDFDLITKNVSVSDFTSFFPPSSTVSAEAHLSGKGFSVNNIMGSVKAEISGLQQSGKALPDIALNATLQRDATPDHDRIDVITSSIADLTIKGKYNIETIGPIVGERFKEISQAIKDRGRYDSAAFISITKICDSIDLNYFVNIKDLRPAAPFIPDIVLLGSGKINGSIIGCEKNDIGIKVGGNIHNFFLKERNLTSDSLSIPRIRLRETIFSFSAENIPHDERVLLREMKAALTIHSDSAENVNGIIIDTPNAEIALDGGNVHYTLSAVLAREIGIYLAGKGNIANTDLLFTPDSLSLAFNKSFVWYSDRNPRITLTGDGSIEIDTLELIKPKPGFDPEHKFAQRIKLGLRIKGDSIDYAYLETPQLDIGDVPKFFPRGYSLSDMKNMSGRVNKLDAHLSGSLSHPRASAELRLRNFTYNEATIDSATVYLQYKDETLSGNGIFHVDTAAYAVENLRQGRENFVLRGNNSFKLEIDSIPLLFSLKKNSRYSEDSALIEKRQMSIRASGEDYPLDIFSPFVPVIAHLHGLANIGLAINGTRENIFYKGAVDIGKASFLLPTTNIEYNFTGKLLLSSGKMELVNIQLANRAGDDPNGRGLLNGAFNFKGFDVQSFELTLSTDRLTVLTDASKETLKNIYGPLAIRTEGSPLKFSGTFDRPLLEGNIGIMQGYLTLPQTETSSATLLNDGITYRIRKEEFSDTVRRESVDSIKKTITEIIGNENPIEYNDTGFEQAAHTETTSATENGPQFTQAQLSFMDEMLYDLNISIPGDLWFTINLSKAYGLIPSMVTANVKSSGNITFARSEAGAPYDFNAKITLTDKSSYTFIKEFSPVTGTLTFVNDISNPSIDIAAEYTGLHKTPAGSDETIKIKLLVTGSSNDPSLRMELYRKNTQGEFIRDPRQQDQVQNDVLTYLTAGYFASDAPGQNQNTGFGNVGTTAVSQLTSAALNNAINSRLLKTGLEYASLQSYKIKLSGDIGGVTYSVGRTVSTTSLSNDFSFEVPLSEFASWGIANSILFQVEGHIAGSNANSLELAQQPLLLGRLLFRIR
jgi:hypothetical protein